MLSEMLRTIVNVKKVTTKLPTNTFVTNVPTNVKHVLPVLITVLFALET
jgi:hypothetical protein